MPPHSSSNLSAAQIRAQFIDFFCKQHAHTFVPANPVVPHEDPTLLFTNAGMNQFKPIFLGTVPPGSPLAGLKRAANSQKCIRAGGKHNDLDDVGKDLYHHTFFEMLGNWSFGDYFKAESIAWGWELLTKVWGLDPDRLYATYFEGSKADGLEPDREAYDLWKRHLPTRRILPGNMKDNFWEMGDTGPCGPCSEIHYDGRSDAERAKVPGDTLVNRSHSDVIEIWNHVFIQFNRTGPGGDNLRPLPAKHVDTGMGLERIVRVVQGKSSNYDTDVFTPYFESIRALSRGEPYEGSLESPRDIAYRVLADHIRTLTFAITDGADPSNEGRGYVLRRILRRAVKYGRQNLGVKGPFLFELVPTVVETMGGFFPELKKEPQRVMDVVKGEEESFGATIDRGMALFDTAAKQAVQQKDGRRALHAEDAFKLHDTFGFPIDLTQIMADERGLAVDVEGFNKLMEDARAKARAGGGAGESANPAASLPGEAVARLGALRVKPTDDSFKFDAAKPLRARVVAIWNGQNLDENLEAFGAKPTDRFAILLDRTNFYAEMGGQVGDRGRLAVSRESKSSVRDASKGGEFEVEDTRAFGGYVLHVGRPVKGEIRVGDDVTAELDRPRRAAIMANHTGTHALNLALRRALGDRVEQKGSLVAPDKLRFDFSHAQAMTPGEIGAVEEAVRAVVREDLPVCAETAPIALARRINGLRAVFGETYPDPVRVVSIGAPIGALVQDPANAQWQSLSIEFCGGTHVQSTGEIGGFAIVEESAVAKGVRRIVALTSKAADEAVAAGEALRRRIAAAAPLQGANLEHEHHAIQSAIESATLPLSLRRTLHTELGALQERVKQSQKQAAAQGRGVAVEAARMIAETNEGPVIVAELKGAGADRDALLAALDSVRARRDGSAVMLFAADESGGKVTVVASVPQPLIAKGLKAGDWVREASAAVGGKGGGRPDSAQGGGAEIAKLPEAIEKARAFAGAKVG